MFAFQVSVLLAFFAGKVAAAIGPVATLNIANSNISPDGYTRSAVLAGGTFPGPVITGTKVRSTFSPIGPPLEHILGR